MRKIILLALTIQCLFAVQTFSQEAKSSKLTDKHFDKVRAYIRQVMEEKMLPSVSVAVAKDGKIIWEEAFGWADREKGIIATPQTMYSIASVTKPMTATAIMRLAEEGKIDLNKPVNDYLGIAKVNALTGNASQATVRRVLSHTSGLPLHYDFFYENEERKLPSADETILRYGILIYPPGEVYQYSNTSYTILDNIIMRISKQDYADYMRTKVFLPLGMRHSSVDIGPGMEQYAAARYDSRQRRIPFYGFSHPGASAIYSSAHDLVLFGMFHLKERLNDQQKILKDSTIDMMQRIETPPNALDPYGLGWFIVSEHGFRKVTHDGGMPGVTATLNLYPSERLAIAVLSNKSDGSIGRIAQEITAAALPKYADARAKQQNQQNPTEKPVPLASKPELIGEWNGTIKTHQNNIPVTIAFQPDGDIHIRMENQLQTLLNIIPLHDTSALWGRFYGTILTEDAMKHRHILLLNLRLQNGILRGQVVAQTLTDPDYFALPSYIELTKKAVSVDGETNSPYSELNKNIW